MIQQKNNSNYKKPKLNTLVVMSFDDDFTSVQVERKLYQEQVKFRLKRFSIDFFLISLQKNTRFDVF
jgi:hypothetical protein